MSEPRYVYRFPPCPIFDTETIESWLEDLARQGLLLSQDGLCLRAATFQKTNPHPMRYRLQPLPRAKFLMDRVPDESAVELAQAYGWDYLCNLQDYAVFCTDDPQARELDTDSQIQALPIRRLYRNKVIQAVLLLAFLLGTFVFLFYFGFLSWMADHSIWYCTSFFVLVALSCVLTLKELRTIRRLIRKLECGDCPDRKKDWHIGRRLHLSCVVFSLAIVLVFWASYYGELLFEDRTQVPFETYSEEIPFASLSDYANLVGNSDASLMDLTSNTIQSTVTLPASRRIQLKQYGSVQGDLRLDASLTVTYYELRTQWLAKALFRELQQKALRSSRHTHLSMPELPTDEAYAYSDYVPCLLLRQNRHILLVRFFQWGADSLTTEQWMQTTAEVFLDRTNEASFFDTQ